MVAGKAEIRNRYLRSLGIRQSVGIFLFVLGNRFDNFSAMSKRSTMTNLPTLRHINVRIKTAKKNMQLFSLVFYIPFTL